MTKKFDWNTVQKSTELIHKEGTTIKIKFLDNDVDVSEWTNPNIENSKPKPRYTFNVLNIDTNKEKTLGIISNPLMNEFKLYEPLMNKEFSIRKYRVGSTDFDIEYEVIHLNKEI